MWNHCGSRAPEHRPGLVAGPEPPGIPRLRFGGHCRSRPRRAACLYKAAGRVKVLENKVAAHGARGAAGIAHTCWASHGVPSERNAHPHLSGDSLALVHNGIIENHTVLRACLLDQGYAFASDTDSEVIVHLLHHYYAQSGDLLLAMRETVAELEGVFAIAVVCRDEPGRLVAARGGSPLVLGFGDNAHYAASDVSALVPFTRDVVFLEDGDIADLRPHRFQVVAAVSEAEDALHGTGRVLLRPSGTEPLLRVMVEGQCGADVNRRAQRIAGAVAEVAA